MSKIITHADSATRPHAKYGPSSLKMFEACPSYASKGGTNAIAQAGTRIHEAVEKGDPTLLVDEAEQSLAQWALSFLEHVRRERNVKLSDSHQEIYLEMSLGKHQTYGTCDLLDLYSDGTGVLMDWKFGFGKVDDAEINSQVQAYAYGAFQKFPSLQSLDCYLVLPRRQEITHATYNRADMDRIKLRLGTIIARASESAGKEFRPTEGVCDYCASQGSCKALAEKALVLGQKAGFDVPQSISLDGTPENKGKLLKLANILEEWCAATKKELLRQSLEEGAEIQGYRLDQRRTPRTVDNPLLAWDSVKDLVTLEEYLLSCTRVSVPQLEKYVSDKAPKGKKSEAKQNLEDVLRESGAMREESTIHLLKPIRA